MNPRWAGLWPQRLARFALLAGCAALLVTQVLIRPAVGIADNGDFAKMAGPLALAPSAGWASHRFAGLTYKYVWSDRNRYRLGFSSSEFVMVRVARAMQRLFQPGRVFDIRWLGFVHAALLFLAAFLWSRAPGAVGLARAALAILICTDVAYVQYLNSFYMDTAAMLSLLTAAAAGWLVTCGPWRPLLPWVMVAAICGFAASKTQHAVPALVFVPLFVAFALWPNTRAARPAWIAGALLLPLIAGVLVRRTPADYKSKAVFNLVFVRLALESPDPLLALQELGLGRDDLRYLQKTAFMDDVPVQSPEGARRFYARCNYGSILRYYWRHPATAMRYAVGDLSAEAPEMLSFANRSPDDGFPPGARTARFAYWSRLRSFLLRNAPWHIALLVLATLAGCSWLLLRSPADRPLAALALAIQTLAAAEFAIAVLADCQETPRHLLLFNVATDVSILLLPILISRSFAVYRKRG